MPTIHVQRERDLLAILRRMKILVDNKQVLLLKRGEVGEVFVPPGQHQVQAAMDRNRSLSVEVNLRDGDTTHFVAAMTWGKIRELFLSRKNSIKLIKVDGVAGN